MGHVVVKYKVTLDQPDDGSPNYEEIANVISDFDEVQEVEIKPLAFGMMYIEVQAVLGEDIDDELEELVRHALTSSPVMTTEQIATGILNLSKWREDQI